MSGAVTHPTRPNKEMSRDGEQRKEGHYMAYVPSILWEEAK
jgi:hypothetical protein